MTFRNLLVALAAGSLLILAGCGGSSSTAVAPPPPPEPTPQENCEAADGRWNADMTCTSAAELVIERAYAAIAAAETPEAAQAAYDAVKDNVTATQGTELQAAVDARIAALAKMSRADMQKMRLMEAAGMIDLSDLSTQALVNAANDAIAGLKAAIAAAVDVDDTSMYETAVTAAETRVAGAQGALDHAAQTLALANAVTALQAIDLTDLSTQAKIDAANNAIAAVRDALAAATELSAAEKTAAMTELATADRTVMTAQGTFDTNAQKAALAEAVATLAALNLDNLMTQEQIDAAVAAITGVDLALAAATHLTDAEKLDATVDVTVAKRKVDRAEMDLAENIDNQRKALMDARDLVAGIDFTDLDTQEKIDAADAALDALEAALVAATHLSDSEKAMDQTQLDEAREIVRVADTGLNREQRMTAQRTAITNAVTMARTAVNGVKNTSTDSEVGSADQAITALEAAIAGAEDLPEGDTDVAMAQGTLATLKAQLNTAKTARTAYLATKADDEMKAMTQLGKDLHAALAGNAVADTTALDNATASLSATGLTITATAGAGAFADADTPPVTGALEAGASAGMLDGWAGTNYAHTDTTSKVVNEARVYTNQGPGTRVAFADAGYTVIAAGNPNAGSVLLVTSGTTETGIDLAKVAVTAFSHSGTQNHPIPDNNVALKLRGTFDGAPGEFSCTAGPCTSTNDGKDGPSALAGTWHFKPDTGAMVHRPDAEYLYFGWWVNKDKDGKPMAASAFVGVVEPSAGDLDNGGDLTALTGSATYVGHAAGKFAMSNPLDGTGSGGHFTADAELKATFGTGATAGVTGTIDNFRLNDGSEDPGWSVALARGALGSADGTITAPTADPTVWSINGNKAPASGTWSGTMYDELPGLSTATPPGDGSNIPTTVTGRFYSEFSTIGRMVGAFGADKQ